MATSIPERHTGADYFRYITSVESDRRARSAFQELILRLAPPGATLFDFGAGPGIDARFLAERGYAVRAYDVDPKMCNFFAEHCSDLINGGRITLERGDYSEFLARPAPAERASLVISNFAPLNLVPDPQELFAKFHQLTAPGGRVLASVINPFYLGDMRHFWWWRRLAPLWRDGYLFMPGPQAPHMRRRPSNFGALSAPYFSLAGIFCGLPAARTRPRAQDSRLRMTRARFLFLLFEKNAGVNQRGSCCSS